MAQGQAMIVWAKENDPWLAGFGGLRRESKGYMTQEKEKLIGQAEPLVKATPAKPFIRRALESLLGSKEE